MTSRMIPLAFLLGFQNGLFGAGIPEPKFRAVEIDSKIEIGYGVTVADVDGDGKPDVLLADKKQFVWYSNPTWQKFVLAENLTELDNVCIAATDIDGDGKAEVAVGAGWNPTDTTNSGAVFYLIPPAERTNKWEPVELLHEPTTHRMRWMRRADGKFDLVVVPLHGRGNKDGRGAGVRILAYKMPVNPRESWSWKTELINDSMHMTHNFDAIHINLNDGRSVTKLPGTLLVAGKEGVSRLSLKDDRWEKEDLFPILSGVGEVRRWPFYGFFATIEPMHGNQVVAYVPSNWPLPVVSSKLRRIVIDSSLKEGHALACGDFLGVHSDQIVAGWRAKNADGKVGIKLFIPLGNRYEKWKETLVDDNTMACEDLCPADLNGDGKVDIVASGRATKNVKIYFNESIK